MPMPEIRPEVIEMWKKRGLSQKQIEYMYYWTHQITNYPLDFDEEDEEGLSTVSLENPSTVDYGFFEGK